MAADMSPERSEAIRRWAADTTFHGMSDDELQRHLESIDRPGEQFRLVEIEGGHRAEFVSFDAPESIAPDGVSTLAAESSSKRQALYGLAELVEMERLGI